MFGDLIGKCSVHGQWNAKLAAACPRCVAAASARRREDCEHRSVLRLSAHHFAGAALQLRQCADCKLIGVVDSWGETVWMREVGP